MSKHTPITTLLQNRGTLLQMLAAAVLLALGVNLLATAIAGALSSRLAVWALSIGLLTLSAIIIVRQTIPSRHMQRKMSGFLVFRSKTSELINVPRYEYNEKVISYVEGLFAENAAPQRLWNSDPVHNAFEFDAKTGTAHVRQTEAGQLVVEATEYFVLETLSTHLTDYFNHSGLESDQLKELSREDVPDIVFKNRFLDTFSRPMRERAAFLTDFDASDARGHTIYSSGPNGIRYSRFDMTLPSEGKLQRLSPNSMLIATPKFLLTISVDFSGYRANLPRDFSELYLEGCTFSNMSTYEVNITTSVEFRPWALLSRSGWDYHAWLDSFLSKLENQFDGDKFLKDINWEAAVTVAQMMHRKLRSGETVKLKSSTGKTGY